MLVCPGRQSGKRFDLKDERSGTGEKPFTRFDRLDFNGFQYTVA